MVLQLGPLLGCFNILVQFLCGLPHLYTTLYMGLSGHHRSKATYSSGASSLYRLQLLPCSIDVLLILWEGSQLRVAELLFQLPLSSALILELDFDFLEFLQGRDFEISVQVGWNRHLHPSLDHDVECISLITDLEHGLSGLLIYISCLCRHKIELPMSQLEPLSEEIQLRQQRNDFMELLLRPLARWLLQSRNYRFESFVVIRLKDVVAFQYF